MSKTNKTLLALIAIAAGAALAVYMRVGNDNAQTSLSKTKSDVIAAPEAASSSENTFSAKAAATSSGPSLRMGGQTFSVDVAATEASREQGLSGRTSLGENQAMLFVFDHPAEYAFWMKGMLFPLDIIWLDSNKKVVHIEKSLSPDTYPRGFAPLAPALYVIEVPAGTADRLGIKQGDPVGISL